MRMPWSGPAWILWIGSRTGCPAIRSWRRGFGSIGETSLGQVERIERCLKSLGSDTSTFKDLASRFLGIAQAYAVAVVPDEAVKDCLAAYTWRHFEIAAYVSLGAAALMLEEPEVARMCNEHLEQERAMATWLEQQIPEVTLEYLRP